MSPPAIVSCDGDPVERVGAVVLGDPIDPVVRFRVVVDVGDPFGTETEFVAAAIQLAYLPRRNLSRVVAAHEDVTALCSALNGDAPDFLISFSKDAKLWTRM